MVITITDVNTLFQVVGMMSMVVVMQPKYRRAMERRPQIQKENEVSKEHQALDFSTFHQVNHADRYKPYYVHRLQQVNENNFRGLQNAAQNAWFVMESSNVSQLAAACMDWISNLEAQVGRRFRYFFRISNFAAYLQPAIRSSSQVVSNELLHVWLL